MPDNFVDLAKQYVLWQGQSGGNVELMLQRSDTNSRENEEMSKWILALGNITKNWRGKYKNLFGTVFTDVQEHYLNMEAYGRKQAIELAAAVARANAPIANDGAGDKKGGIFSIFGR